jgi:hypothetical protein
VRAGLWHVSEAEWSEAGGGGCEDEGQDCPREESAEQYTARCWGEWVKATEHDRRWKSYTPSEGCIERDSQSGQIAYEAAGEQWCVQYFNFKNEYPSCRQETDNCANSGSAVPAQLATIFYCSEQEDFHCPFCAAYSDPKKLKAFSRPSIFYRSPRSYVKGSTGQGSNFSESTSAVHSQPWPTELDHGREVKRGGQ